VTRGGKKTIPDTPTLRRLNPDVYAPAHGPSRRRKPGVPNRTEARYFAAFLGEYERSEFATVRYQPWRLYLPNGHSYRPDFVVIVHDPVRIQCHEVKGPHIHSRDSRILFDTARAVWPWFDFVWAQWTGSEWRVEGPEE